MDMIPVFVLESLGARSISMQPHGAAERAGLDPRQVDLHLSVAPTFAL